MRRERGKRGGEKERERDDISGLRYSVRDRRLASCSIRWAQRDLEIKIFSFSNERDAAAGCLKIRLFKNKIIASFPVSFSGFFEKWIFIQAEKTIVAKLANSEQSHLSTKYKTQITKATKVFALNIYGSECYDKLNLCLFKHPKRFNHVKIISQVPPFLSSMQILPNTE